MAGARRHPSARGQFGDDRCHARATSRRFGPPEGAVTVYVDPASAHVTGEITESERPDE
ncbi:hypothetical protein [Salinactinospora qingdaonensis]|uniref:hypothetical protein n=1 Tax=Salinactinospora qingdaonensis TaxID=702744 RepID=UPI0031ED6AB3